MSASSPVVPKAFGEACIRRFAREGAHVVMGDIDALRGAALASDAASYITGEIVVDDDERTTLNRTV